MQIAMMKVTALQILADNSPSVIHSDVQKMMAQTCSNFGE